MIMFVVFFIFTLLACSVKSMDFSLYMFYMFRGSIVWLDQVILSLPLENFDDRGNYVVDCDNNLMIICPDILSEHRNLPLIFKTGLLKELATRKFLEEYTGIVLKRTYMPEEVGMDGYKPMGKACIPH
ncbi:hypothetical protein DsansV1_C21g0168001 [Dioscorea sansibarensis]